MKKECSKGCYKEGGNAGRRILPMANKPKESELKQVNMYVDFMKYKNNKKFFSIALLEYKNTFKKVVYLNGTKTAIQSIPIVIYKAIGKLNENCVVNVYVRNSYGLKTIVNRYKSGIAPCKISYSQSAIDLINVMRTSGHIVKINLDNDLFAKKVLEKGLDDKLNEIGNVIRLNEKWSNLDEERIDDLCFDKIYEIQKEYLATGKVSSYKLSRLYIDEKDDFSKLNLNKLKSSISKSEYSEIERISSTPRDMLEIIRWSCRGLGKDLAIQKFLLKKNRKKKNTTLANRVEIGNSIMDRVFSNRLDREYCK